MEKTNQAKSAPGADEQIPTTEQLVAMIERDSATAIAFLQALRTDKNCLQAMAEHMQGNWINAMNRDRLAKEAATPN